MNDTVSIFTVRYEAMGLTICQVAHDIECEKGQPGMQVDNTFDTRFSRKAIIHFCYKRSNGPLHKCFIRQYGGLSEKRIHGLLNTLVPCRIGT